MESQTKKLTKKGRFTDFNYNLLLQETAGFIEPDEYEKTYQISQKEICEKVDITSATKSFDLKLNYGPYYLDYFRNGRQMLFGGERGHVAVLDWITKRLILEFNVMESVHAVKWLHMPNLFAVAQRDFVHIYEDKGTQMHCLKKLYKIEFLEYLPYHFLLVSASNQGFLSWVDTSYGEIISQFRPKKVRKIMCMTQNPTNGVVLTGHSNGVINMWTPNTKEADIQMLCHSGSLTDVKVTLDGKHMVSLGIDRHLKIWDLRMLKSIQNYRLRSIGSCLDVSQKDFIAVGTGNNIQIFKDSLTKITEPYLLHKTSSFAKNLRFCNFEDVLGIGHGDGVSSILVPGSGEPNFDGMESNPFMTSSQRKEMEVKMLLSKIPPELIHIDPEILGVPDIKQLKNTIAEKKKLGYVKVPKIKFNEKKSMKLVDKYKLKKRLHDEARRKEIKKSRPRPKTMKVLNRFFVKKGFKKGKKSDSPKDKPKPPVNVLNRFKPK